MIVESVVFEGLYFDEVGQEISPAELVQAVATKGYVTVYNEDGERVGNMIQLRRMDGCLEGLIETCTST